MTILKFPTKTQNPPFFNDIIEDGYHIFNLNNAKKPDYYLNEFSDYPGVSLRSLKIGDTITVRVFFRVGAGENIRVDGGYLDLAVEHIDSDKILAVILTELPEGFPLGQGIP